MRVVDTRRTFRPRGLTKLNGRKYVCETCITELGEALGMETSASVRERANAMADDAREIARLQRELDDARAAQVRVVAAGEISDAVSETIRAELARRISADAFESE